MIYITLDFRLIEISAELHALNDYLVTVEHQLALMRESENRRLQKDLQALSADDPESDLLRQEFYERHNCVYPRLFWGSYLISLDATYESAVTEISRLMQKENQKSLDDIKRGTFLERAKRYYRDTLHLELCTNKEWWDQIVILHVVRNAYAHANGRWEMVKKKSRESIEKWDNNGSTIDISGDYIIANLGFSKVSYNCVRDALCDLIERYKGMDNVRTETT